MTAAIVAIGLMVGCTGSIDDADQYEDTNPPLTEQALRIRWGNWGWPFARDAGARKTPVTVDAAVMMDTTPVTTTPVDTTPVTTTPVDTTPVTTPPVTTPPVTTTPVTTTPVVTTPPDTTTIPAPTTTTAPQTSVVPLGGPSGYKNVLLNDVFGSARSDANITSVGAFNPSSPYGESGKGWDSRMRFWNSTGEYASASMGPTYLELYPSGGPASVIVSHLSVLPTATRSYYIEVQAITGRGQFNDNTTSWPCMFLYAGNESGGYDQGSEIDFMETYTDLAFKTAPNSEGLYTEYFTTTMHNAPDGTQLGGPWPIPTPGIDVTTTMNTYGIELWLQNGQINWNVYFNGNYVQSAPFTLPWLSSAPAIVLGWNPKQSPHAGASMKIDHVRVWSK